MKIIFKELNKEQYEKVAKGLDLPLTQNAFYGEWQVALGKKIWRYGVEGGGKIVTLFQIVKYAMPFGQSYLYIPHGPVFIGDFLEEFLPEFEKFCLDLLKKEKSVFLRADFLGGQGMKIGIKAPRFLYDGNFQPKYESIINLAKSEEEILAGMKKVNRYTIKQAEKQGFEVKIFDKNFSDYLNKFYELVSQTAERDNFLCNQKNYYAEIFSQCEVARNGFMEAVSLRGEILLINFFVVYGDSAYFLFSGSENEKRKLGYTYLAQWEAMRHFKKIGFRKYNLGAVLPENDKHPFYKKWLGFSDFKKRFGGRILEYPDFYDITGRRFWYGLYVLKRFLGILF